MILLNVFLLHLPYHDLNDICSQSAPQIRYTILRVDSTANNPVCCTSPLFLSEFLSFPSSLSRPRLHKHFIANRIWLRREYIHHAFLSFSKVNSLENMKTCPAVYVFLCTGVRVCQVKSPSKSSIKVQTTLCLPLQWNENKRHLLSHACVYVCARARSWRAPWVSEQTLSVTRELTHQTAAIRCSTPLLLLLLPSHFLLSHPLKDSQGCLSCVFSVASKCCLIGLVNFSHPCFLFLLCTSLISCIRPPPPSLSLS